MYNMVGKFSTCTAQPQQIYFSKKAHDYKSCLSNVHQHCTV